MRELYRVLPADGYCCIIPARGLDQPLTFGDSILQKERSKSPTVAKKVKLNVLASTATAGNKIDIM